MSADLVAPEGDGEPDTGPTVATTTSSRRELEVADHLDALMHRRRGRAPRGTHRMAALCRELGDPQRDIPTVHVAGTDGKSSIVRIIGSLLTSLGYRTGETTSPHLQEVTERIRIDGAQVTRSELLAGLAVLEPVIGRAEEAVGEPVTFFEAITALALRRFAEEPVDAAVVEAGIGGVGDATNVVDSRVAVLSLVGRDHAELGDTLGEVAAEKAGIVTPGGVVVSAAQRSEALEAIERVVAERGGQVLLADRDLGVMARRPGAGGQYVDLRGLDDTHLRGWLPLVGAHQAANAAVAFATVQRFLGTTDLDQHDLRTGLAAVRLPGRVEVVRPSVGPTIVLDGAHDREAARALAQTVAATLQPSGVTIVLGVSGGRDPGPLLSELAALDGIAGSPVEVVVTQASSPTSMPVRELARRVRRGGFRVTVASDPEVAVQAAARTTPVAGCLVVTGSLHLVGEVRGLVTASWADGADDATVGGRARMPLVS